MNPSPFYKDKILYFWLIGCFRHAVYCAYKAKITQTKKDCFNFSFVTYLIFFEKNFDFKDNMRLFV